MNSDFDASKLHVKMYIDEYKEIPFQILQFLIGVINYGGRVTDDKDAKLISAILSKYVNDLVLDDLYKFDDNGVYYPPVVTKNIPDSLIKINEYLETLPLDDSPDVFGLHYNANITLQNKMVREFMEPLIAIQPRSSSSNVKKPDDIVLELRDILFVKFSEIDILDKSKGCPVSIYEKGDSKWSAYQNERPARIFRKPYTSKEAEKKRKLRQQQQDKENEGGASNVPDGGVDDEEEPEEPMSYDFEISELLLYHC